MPRVEGETQTEPGGSCIFRRTWSSGAISSRVSISTHTWPLLSTLPTSLYSLSLTSPLEKASAPWGLVDAYDLLSCSRGFRSGPRTGWEGMWLGPGLTLPLAHLLCTLVQVTLFFCASVSWAQ